jgi:HSP20 family protein
MAPKTKRSFFERLTGSIKMEDFEEEVDVENEEEVVKISPHSWIEEENDEAELAVDVYQTPRDMIIQTMVAGVKPEHIEVTIARDVIVIKGKREDDQNIDDENYFTKELYWGKFSRTISLPQEVEPEFVEALEKHGLLTIKIQKVDKEKRNTIKVKSV